MSNVHIFAMLINESNNTNIRKMRKLRKLRLAPSLPKLLRALHEGEAVKVANNDCKETALRVVATRLKKEGLCYRVNAADGYCIVTRIA